MIHEDTDANKDGPTRRRCATSRLLPCLENIKVHQAYCRGPVTGLESTMESAVLEIDIEAQQQQSDELVVVVERT